jgi:hypothetical protein
MREHEGSVNIGADFENHRDGEEAVTRRLAADVVHRPTIGWRQRLERPVAFLQKLVNDD